MIRRAARTAWAGVLAAALGCGGGAPVPGAGEPLRAVATTSIVADLVRAIGGDLVELSSLMGPGVDPHLYQPTAGDVRRMAAAHVVFYSGLHLEGKMTEVFEEMASRGVPTVAVAECVPAADRIAAAGFGGLYDPHVWFDVRLWMRAAGCVSERLAALDPTHAQSYRERAQMRFTELDALDRWVRERIAAIPENRRVLVTAHDAFSYFGRAYGVEVRGLLGVSTAAEAGTSDVQELATFIASRRLPAIFVESSVPPRYVEALQQAVRAKGLEVAIGGTLYSDALGDPGGPAADYLGTVRANVETIAAALSIDAPGGGAALSAEGQDD